MVDLTLLLQGSVLHKDHGCGPSLPGEPSPRPRPKPNRLLPDEHPHYATLHLPVSPWWERPQHQGTDRRRLWLVCQRQRGVCLHVWMVFELLFSLDGFKLYFYDGVVPSSMPEAWWNSSRTRTSKILKCGPARWRERSRQQSAWECHTNSGNLSMK